MNYENARDILPEELLKELQKYAAGKLLYIPSGEDRKAWGESSGYREQLQKRNLMIRNKYAYGRTVSELADEYCLSLDSIKKIIYSKKHEDSRLTYSPTVASAVQYADAGMLEEWMHCYLLFTPEAAPLVDDFRNDDRHYFGVVKFPLRLIERERLESGGGYAEEREDQPASLPPLLIQYEEGKFSCIVQRELLAALIQRKVNAYPTIVVLTGNADYKRFMKYYGTVLFFVQ
ncbi:hypothetical protein J31TS4_38620 [Paenibacillus sp. J31TS4]|uniref:CD3324 family protein n=1 Tax=Paenibacillus sp. J31TS4 TaxID=2807195 RepID=UPI001B1A289F|nr:CD3324 family protein [Paenibacillus sp. J31TS4]GIP40582.1 hypothetical protein J31TS4_38620 [Paenibacillus sp. J31TS4]